MKQNPQTIEQYAAAILAAAEAAKAADKLTGNDDPGKYMYHDGGTCNFDTPLIDFSGWMQKDVDLVQKKSGINISEKLSGYFKGFRMINVPLNGQAMNRTHMAEAANRTFKEMNIPSSMWYQMD